MITLNLEIQRSYEREIIPVVYVITEQAFIFGRYIRQIHIFRTLRPILNQMALIPTFTPCAVLIGTKTALE